MYYVISTQIMQDGSNAQSIMPYTDKNEALSAFHSIMASNYISAVLKTCACTVLNEIGGRIDGAYIEFASSPSPEPDPEA